MYVRSHRFPLPAIFGAMLITTLTAGVAESRQPPEPRQPRLVEREDDSAQTAARAVSSCRSGMTATVSDLYYPRAGGAGSCATTVTKAEGDVTSHHYRSACQAKFGGPLPATVLSVSATCKETSTDFVVEATVCCPDPCDSLDEPACSRQRVCTWGVCSRTRGSLTCNDLSGQALCDRYEPWCDWKTAECKKRPEVLTPFECNDLTANDCGRHSECSMQSECRHRRGSLTCSDLDQNQCPSYGKWCQWKRGKCKKKLKAGPFECNDLSADDCRREGECSLRTLCRRRSGSLTCNDLAADECPRYGRWCTWKPDRCIKDPLVPLPFECNDLSETDCGGQRECSWQDICRYTG